MAAATAYDKMPIRDIRDDARRNAQAVLDEYWDDSYPVDPVKIARKMGVEVFTAELGDDVFGMMTGNPSQASIYLDVDQPHVRMRFTCAHELGHYVERSSRLAAEDDPQFAEIDRRSDEGRGRPLEIFANEFAASLLMPEQQVKDLHRQGKSRYDMVTLFQVSLAAVDWRLHHLNLK
ncbi:ImmA/IrrE family metallo-endopeptidase [Sinomonas albida]|uniref:ImmA/IrrE family metallo-endopeptidase n=1 Tax=Sinomonas albida TaxID=369942 RepID=UPI00301AB2CD